MIMPTPDHIARAVIAIRRMRGVQAGADGFPGDLGCETQLYLGCAMAAVFPRLKMTQIAEMCGVEIGDALFFADLCGLASGGRWMVGPILNVAASNLAGKQMFVAKRVSPAMAGVVR